MVKKKVHDIPRVSKVYGHDERLTIYNCYLECKSENEVLGRKMLSTRAPMKRAAKYCGVSEKVIQSIVKEVDQFGKPQEQKLTGKRQVAVDFPPYLPRYIKRLIKSSEKKRKAISFFDVRRNVAQVFNLVYKKSRWNRYMRSLGWRYGKCRTTFSAVKQSLEMRAWRSKFLRTLTENRSKPDNERYLEVYLDETYCHRHHNSSVTIYQKSEGRVCNRPSGPGDRYVIIGAGSVEGWVKNSLLVFKSGKKTGDYHGNMSSATFVKWFSEKLLPNLPAGKKCLERTCRIPAKHLAGKFLKIHKFKSTTAFPYENKKSSRSSRSSGSNWHFKSNS
jgi:transposase